MKWFPTGVMLLASTACASWPPVARDFDDLADYRAASFTEVWGVVIDVLADRNWAIYNLERDRGAVATDWMKDVDLSYLDCGIPGLRAVDYDHEGRFDVVVRETDNGVSIRVTTSWQAVRNTSNSIGIVKCLSTGILERQLHDEVRRRLES